MTTYFVSWGDTETPKRGQLGMLAEATSPEEAATLALRNLTDSTGALHFFVAEVTPGETWTLKIRKVAPKETLN